MIRSFTDGTPDLFDYTTNPHLMAGCISATSVQKSDRKKVGRCAVGEINKRFFEGLMADAKISMRALAERMGMQHSQLSLTFSGARRLQLEEAVQLSSIFSVSLDKVIEAAGVPVTMPTGRRAQVVGTMAGDGTVHLYDTDVIERTNAPDTLPPDCIAVQARTSGTPLQLVDGWVAFCRPHQGVAAGVQGALCLVKVRGGPEALAVVQRGYKENSYNLAGPYNAESVKLEYATPVLLLRP